MIKVHHLKNTSQGIFLSRDKTVKAWQQGGFELVAEVDAQFLESAWQNTNHIDEPWWNNECVTLVKKSRSSQVGDIFEQHNTLHIVCHCGFEKLGCPVSIPVQSDYKLKKSA